MVPVLSNPAPAAVLVLTCLCAVPLRAQKPDQVDPLTARRSNPQCWDSSSALLLKMRSPRIADTVPAFWDLMGTLRASENGKHTALFWDLARVFWANYLDCVLSRSHGLGRRQVTSVRSLITDNAADDDVWVKSSLCFASTSISWTFKLIDFSVSFFLTYIKESFKFNSSRANSWTKLTISVRCRGHIRTLKTEPK